MVCECSRVVPGAMCKLLHFCRDGAGVRQVDLKGQSSSGGLPNLAPHESIVLRVRGGGMVMQGGAQGVH